MRAPGVLSRRRYKKPVGLDAPPYCSVWLARGRAARAAFGGELREVVDVALHALDGSGALVAGERLVQRGKNVGALLPPRIEAFLLVRRAAFIPVREVIGDACGELLAIFGAMLEQGYEFLLAAQALGVTELLDRRELANHGRHARFLLVVEAGEPLLERLDDFLRLDFGALVGRAVDLVLLHVLLVVLLPLPLEVLDLRGGQRRQESGGFGCAAAGGGANAAAKPVDEPEHVIARDALL